MNKYKIEFTAKCPNNSMVVDKYKLTLKTENLIQVEEIIAYVEMLQRESVFQEDLTKKIAEHFNCTAKIIGWHFNVKVVSKHYK